MNIIKELNVRFLQQASAIGMNHLTDIDTRTKDSSDAAIIVYLAINEISEVNITNFISYTGINLEHRRVLRLKRRMNTIERLTIKEVVGLIKAKLPVNEIDKIMRDGK